MTERWEADDEQMRVRSILADHVLGHLTRGEQEYGFAGFGDRDRVRFTGYVPTMVKSVLRHRFADVEWVYVFKEDEANEKVEDLSGLVEENPVPDVEGVQATLPVGAITVKGTIRTNDQLSGVINTPAEVESVREAFNGREGGGGE